MIKVSDAFNKAFASPTRQVLAKVTMNDVVYTNNDLSSVEYDGESISGENFNIGSTFSNGIKLTFPKIIDGVKQLDKIKLEFGIVLPDGSSEYVSMGYFFVSAYDPQRNEKRTVIEAFDEMAQLEGSYSSKLTYPAKIQDVALEIANKAGVVINKASFERLSQNKISKIQGLTYRQAIGIIAQFAYGYAIFDRNGQLDIRMLKDPNFSIATADYFSRGLTKNETMYTLNGINCRVSTKGTESNEDYILQSGSDKGNQISLENNVMTQIYLDDIYQHLKTLNYYPFTLSWRGNPAIEAGDWLSMTDITGKVFKIPNLSYRLNFSGGLKATSSANTSSVAITSSEYKGSLHQKVEALEGWRNASGGWSYTQVQEPKNPQEGDVWYKPNGPDTELWVYEGGEWVLKTSTAKNRELEDKLNQAKEETNAALAEKDKAIKDLDKKVDAEITETNNSVSKAQADATAAKAQADAAVAKANANVIEIDNAKEIADTAKSLSDKAIGDSAKAINDAKTAYDKATENAGKIVTVNQEIDEVKGSITTKVDKTVFDKSLERITQAESSITQNANAITQKVSSTDVENILTGKAYATKSELTQTSNSLTSTISGLKLETDKKASQIQVTQLSQDLDGFKFTVSNTNTGLTNESLISTQMMVDTKLTHPNYPDMPMVEIPVVNGENYTLSTNQPFESNAAHVFLMTSPSVPPSTYDNGAYDGKSKVTVATSTKLYVVFRNNSYLSRFVDGKYWVRVSKTVIGQSQVASQIAQSATEIRQDLQSWTNGQLTNYSTIQSTATSIASAVSSKADKTQITQLSDQITSTVTSLTNETLITTQLIKDTTLRHPNFSDMPMVEISVTNGESYTVSSNMPNRGTVTASITDVFYLQLQTTVPNSNINGVFEGKNITLPAISDKIYIVFRTQASANQFISGKYWVKVSKTPASQSQITQLVNDINLRVIKGDVVNQINISPESILIAGNKIQITGETYIENGVIDNAKIKTLSANKLTAGTIDAAKINVLNINAANITTGILNADRIGANSITATHINVANLAAISANLGIITAGTINAATVRIINLDAGAISTGTLNANLIAAYSITADKIKATSLDLFNNDFYTNVQPDGMRMQGKAQIIFGKWKDSSGAVRNSEGIYIGGYNAGIKYVALTRADGSTFMLRANSDMDIGTNKNVAKESLNIYDTAHFWYPQINHSDLTLNGYLAMGGDFQEASIQYDKASATLAFRVPGGRSGSAFWFNQNVNAAGSFNSTSLLSLKDVKGGYQGNALEDILHTDIVEYSYKNNPKARQLSPIIDDVNKIKQFTLPDIINDGKTVNLYAMSSLSWLAIQQLAEKLENIEEKIDAIA